MTEYSAEELEQARKAMISLIGKCEKAQESLRRGTAQWTTLNRRLQAFRMAAALIEEKIASESLKQEEPKC